MVLEVFGIQQPGVRLSGTHLVLAVLPSCSTIGEWGHCWSIAASSCPTAVPATPQLPIQGQDLEHFTVIAAPWGSSSYPEWWEVAV